MELRRLRRCVSALLAFGCLGPIASGQEPAAAPHNQPPKLHPEFRDEFQEDSTSRYAIKGDVEWESGKLTLNEGAAIGRSFKSGPWVRFIVRLQSLDLNSEPQSELRVRFSRRDSTDCYLRVRLAAKVGYELALVEVSLQDGKPTPRVVREVVTDGVRLSLLDVEYRYGLVLVRLAGQPPTRFAAFVGRSRASVTGGTLELVNAECAITSVAVEASGATTRVFTQDEERQLQEASSVENKLVALHGQRRFAEAAELGGQVVAIRKAILGEFHMEYANALWNLARIQTSQGDHAGSEPVHKAVLAIHADVLGEHHPEYASTLFSLAIVHHRMGQLTLAEREYTRAREIRREVLGQQHPDHAHSMNSLAGLYHHLGDYPRAEGLYKQSLQIYKTRFGEQHRFHATSLNNLAAIYASMGEYARAEQFFKKAQAIYIALRLERTPEYAISLDNLGDAYRRMGDYGRALEQSRRALDIIKSLVGERHPYYAKTLNNVAALHYAMADFASARPLYEQARGILRDVGGGQHLLYGTTLTNLADVYESMGEYELAEPVYREALRLSRETTGEKHPDFALRLNNLAHLYRSMGDPSRARPLVQQAINILQETQSEQHPLYATTLERLADLDSHLGEYPGAKKLLEQAVKLRASVQGVTHPHYAHSLHNLAAFHYDAGDYASAEPLFRQAASVFREHTHTNAVVQSARQQVQNQAINRLFLDSLLSNAIVQQSGDVEAIAAELWQWKGAVTARQHAYRAVARDPRVSPIFGQLRSVTHRLSSALDAAPIPPPKEASGGERELYEQQQQAWQQRVATLTREREELEGQIAANSEDFRRLTDRLTTDRVQSLLPKATAFIDFLQYTHRPRDRRLKGASGYDRKYLALIVREDAPVALVGLGSARSINAAISDFRKPLTAGSAQDAAALQAAERLQETLWRPLEEHLDGIETVIISPDTVLGTLPFAALPGRRAGRYLIEDYRLATIPFAGLLNTLLTDSVEPNTGLLVLGDVDYDSAVLKARRTADQSPGNEQSRLSVIRGGRSVDWPSLPGFRAELEMVTRLHRRRFATDATILSAAEATESSFLDQAQGHGTLHLITHGFFTHSDVESIQQAEVAPSSDQGPDPFFRKWLPGLLSGLVMAGANNPSEDPENFHDGVLRAAEIEAIRCRASISLCFPRVKQGSVRWPAVKV